ncbi:hypothetical protein ACE1CD_15215 [Aerosakkonema sp. BLCC-F183]
MIVQLPEWHKKLFWEVKSKLVKITSICRIKSAIAFQVDPADFITILPALFHWLPFHPTKRKR